MRDKGYEGVAGRATWVGVALLATVLVVALGITLGILGAILVG